VAEPKHWRAEKNGNGAQAWLVGQAVALREMSWRGSQNQNEENRLAALRWLLDNAYKTILVLPQIAWSGVNIGYDKKRFDEGARDAASKVWPDEWTRKLLFTFAGLSKDFQDSSVSQSLQARRAERLVLALDRLIAALPELKKNEPVQSALNELFKLAQSIPDFDPKQFSVALQKFSAALANQP
jgi:hypothetical protein